jgi:hypothetical protein
VCRDLPPTVIRYTADAPKLTPEELAGFEPASIKVRKPR